LKAVRHRGESERAAVDLIGDTAIQIFANWIKLA